MTATIAPAARLHYRAEVIGQEGQFFTVSLRGFGPLKGRTVRVHWMRVNPYLSAVAGEVVTLYSADLREDDVEEFLD